MPSTPALTPMRSYVLPVLTAPRQLWRAHADSLRLALLVATAYAIALAMDMP